MDNALYIGLDVGTQSSKAVVYTEAGLAEAGEPVSSGRADTPWTFTTTGAECDADRLLEAATTAVPEPSMTVRTGGLPGWVSPAWPNRGCCWTGAGAPLPR